MHPRAGVIALFVAIVGLGVPTVRAQSAIHLYFAHTNDPSGIPPSYVDQTNPAFALGETAYLWAYVETGDTWNGVLFDCSCPMAVAAGEMYNPIMVVYYRWDEGSDLSPVGDGSVAMVATISLGLGSVFDTLAVEGHHLVGEITVTEPCLLFLVNQGMYRWGGSPADVVYLGFGDDPVPSTATGAASEVPDVYFGGDPGEFGACCYVDGSCEMTLENTCWEASGVFMGAGTHCDQTYCVFPGEMNCDHAVDFADINPFVLALTSPAAYGDAFPGCNRNNADCNEDGVVDFGDINAFVALVAGG